MSPAHEEGRCSCLVPKYHPAAIPRGMLASAPGQGESALLVQRRWLQEQGMPKTVAVIGMKKTRLLEMQGLATISAHLLSGTDPRSGRLQRSKPELEE